MLGRFQLLRNNSNIYACKALDDLINLRLSREEHGTWIEKAVITRIWISTSDVDAENALEKMQEMFDMVLQESNSPLSAPATHAAQTLLWKKVEEASAREQHDVAESWCQLCLHMIFERAGAQNKVKVTRFVISSCCLAPAMCMITDCTKEDHSVCTFTARLCDCS